MKAFSYIFLFAALFIGKAANAQVSVDVNGQQYACSPIAASPTPSTTATIQPTPIATPTPQSTVAFQAIFMPLPPIIAHSSLWPYWIVEPANSDNTSKVVAFVNVTINGVQQPSYKGGATGHTFDYRLGGQPIPGVTVSNGTFNWNIGSAGTYSFVFNAYNDAGQLLQSVLEQAVVTQ